MFQGVSAAESISKPFHLFIPKLLQVSLAGCHCTLSVSVYLWIISAVYCTHCQEQQSLEASLLICLFTKHVPERIRGKQRKHQPPRGIQGCYCRRQGLWENLTTQGLHYRRLSRGKYTLAHLFFCKFI